MSDKGKIRTRLIIEGVIAFLIVISPILFYFYKYIPKTEENWEFLHITFTNNGYRDVGTAFYYYLTKIVPLTLLTIWFITCKRWWYHAILIPIAMYSFQLYSVLSEDITKIDENEILYLLGVCMLVVPVVYLIRIKLVDKYVHGIDLEAMEQELQELKEKQAREKARQMAKINKQIEGASPAPNDADLMEEVVPSPHSPSKIKQFQGQLSNWINFKF
ncbi:hypothetical protein [Pseudozobellia thermophila]|uniref:Uncharacterized protein n=1 Tax=Pseudozobellia thermophila TaxID=192903 RepID=A0A1M6EXD4_9FLAO|nr:hypothetical protein [Pseudozobellia thermophila]SHI90066.1 hypothetical protein SAMN04488513_102214 [Pseudozobellia thermophila]